MARRMTTMSIGAVMMWRGVTSFMLLWAVGRRRQVVAVGGGGGGGKK